MILAKLGRFGSLKYKAELLPYSKDSRKLSSVSWTSIILLPF